MSESSARWQLPLIEPGQAQKEVFHNEALTRLDLLVQASVVAAGVDTPPASPAAGEAWVVGPAPIGAWSGQANALAGWTAGGWRFVAPREGMAVWSAATDAILRWRAGTWEGGRLRGTSLVVDGTTVVRAHWPAIVDPSGGNSIDARARTAVTQILDALRAHGLIAS